MTTRSFPWARPRPPSALRCAAIRGDLHLGLAGGAASLHDHRVLRGQHEDRRAEHRVEPGREDPHLLPRAVDREVPRRPRPPDPVPLHRQDALLGPRLEELHLVEQVVGVVGDLEEPLRQILRLDLRSAPLAAPVDHLLVREHGLILLRAPLDGRLAPVGQPTLEEPQEQPLRPAEYSGSAVETSRDQSIAQPIRFICLRIDSMLRLTISRGWPPSLDRGVLRGQAERVVAHRAQHRVPLPAPYVGEDVSEGVVEDVPHVELARGLRQHLEHVGADRASGDDGLGGIGSRERVLGRPDPAATSPRSSRARIARPLVCSIALGSTPS